MKKDPRQRYSQTQKFSVSTTVGTPFYGLLPRKLESLPGYVLHMIVDGDRLDRLAHHYYGDPRLWWAIAQANPGLITPTDLLRSPGSTSDQAGLEIGKEIQIPPKPEAPQ